MGGAGNNALGVTGVAWTINLYICNAASTNGGLYSSSTSTCYTLCGQQVQSARGFHPEGCEAPNRHRFCCLQLDEGASAEAPINLRALLPPCCSLTCGSSPPPMVGGLYVYKLRSKPARWDAAHAGYWCCCMGWRLAGL